MGNILIIKHSALGDFIQALPAMKAIRQYHRDGRIGLLTTSPYKVIAEICPWIDEIIVDKKPKIYDMASLLKLRRQLREWDRIYDLQTSYRSSLYMYLWGRRDWCGISPLARWRDTNPERKICRGVPRLASQLKQVGISSVPDPALHWLQDEYFVSTSPYAVLICGTSRKRSYREKWPVKQFSQLARMMVDRGIVPVIVGSNEEAALAEDICSACPEARNLTGKTTIMQLADIMVHARYVVGNDTGPMHLAAAMGGRCVVLMLADQRPIVTAPTRRKDGKPVDILVEKDLLRLSVDRVASILWA